MSLKKYLIGFIFCLSYLTYAQYDEDCSLLYYPFNNNANNTVLNDFHGTIYGASLSTDMFNSDDEVYEFDGINDYIAIENQPVVTTENFTITTWVKMQGPGGGGNQRNPVFVQRNNIVSSTSSLIGLFGQYVDNKVTFLVRNQNSVNTNAIIAEADDLGFNEWHFLAAVKDDSFIKLYIDSMMVDSVACPILGSFSTNTDNSDIGRHYYNNSAKSYFNGKIDDFRIFDCALEGYEILDIYNETLEEEDTTNNVSVLDYNKPNVEIFPNPTNSIIHLQNYSSNNLAFKLYTLEGSIIEEGVLEGKTDFDLSTKPAGTYFIQVFDNVYSDVFKIIKTNI